MRCLGHHSWVQVCEALGHMHALGLVHRDVRPENILLTSKDLNKCKAKLSDFSSVATGSAWRKDDQRLYGASGHMAPEMLLGEMELGSLPKLDTWGLGVTLYIILSGMLPGALCVNQRDLSCRP